MTTTDGTEDVTESIKQLSTDEPAGANNQADPPRSEKVKNSQPAGTQQPSLKIEVLLKPTGSAPILSKKKWSVERTKTIAGISEFVHKFLKCEPQETVYLYINQAFAPAPDVDVGSLYECFGSDGKLILHYCMTQAWG